MPFCFGTSPLLTRLVRWSLLHQVLRTFVVRLTLIMYPLEVLWFEMLHWPLEFVHITIAPKSCSTPPRCSCRHQHQLDPTTSGWHLLWVMLDFCLDSSNPSFSWMFLCWQEADCRSELGTSSFSRLRDVRVLTGAGVLRSSVTSTNLE